MFPSEPVADLGLRPSGLAEDNPSHPGILAVALLVEDGQVALAVLNVGAKQRVGRHGEVVLVENAGVPLSAVGLAELLELVSPGFGVVDVVDSNL